MIGKNSARLETVVTKKEAKIIQEMAKKEDRTVSQMVAVIIRRGLKK